MKLDEIRAKYPQYNSLSDEVLADRLYQKNYAGKIDRDDFNQRIGLQPKSMLSKGVDAVKSVASSAVDAWKGDAEFDLPNINQAGKGNFKTSMASMFGGDDDYVRAAQAANPDLEFTQDKNGNPMAVDASGKPLFYVNQPGMDVEDVTRFAGKALSFAPTGILATMPAKLMGRTAAATGGAAATDAVMQKLSGRENVDPVQVGVTGLAGAFGEMAGAGLSKLAKSINWRGKPTIAEGRKVMVSLGLDPANAPDDVILKYATAARQHIDPKVRPESVIAAKEFGFKPDPSQQLDDFWRARDVAKEASPRVVSSQNQQFDDVMAAGDRIAKGMGGRADDAVEHSMQSLLRESGRRFDEASDAYAQAGKLGGSVKSEAFDDLFQRVNAFADTKFMRGEHNKALYPASRAIMGNMDDLASQIKTLRASADVTEFNAPFEAVENFRQAIIGATKSAQGKDLSNAKGLMKEFDGWVDDVFDNNLINGSPEFLSQAKEARALWSRYKNDFGERWFRKGTDTFGKKLEQFTNADGSMDAESMANFVLGAGNQINSTYSKEFARRLKHVLPEDGYDAFRQAAFEKLMTNANTGESLGSLRALSNNLKSALQGKNKGVFDELLKPEERALVERYTAAIEGLLPGGNVQRQGARSSGTAERGLGMLLERISNIPILGSLSKMHQASVNAQYANPALMQQAQTKATTALAPAAANN